jgi:hypothetical protein
VDITNGKAKDLTLKPGEMIGDIRAELRRSIRRVP